MLPDYQKAYNACYAYYKQRKSTGSLVLFWSVEIMYHDWLNYRID